MHFRHRQTDRRTLTSYISYAYITSRDKNRVYTFKKLHISVRVPTGERGVKTKLSAQIGLMKRLKQSIA